MLLFTTFLYQFDIKGNSLSSSYSKYHLDTSTTFSYRVSLGGSMFTPATSFPIPGSGYHFDFTQNDTRIYSVMHNSQGFVFRNEVILDLKYNPISPCVDFAYALGNFNMIVYDTSGKEISHSWFRKINLATVGVGFNINGRYLNVGLMYRVGFCSGGIHENSIPVVPDIVKNNKLNLTSSIYQGLDISIGAQYKNFHLSFRRVIPMTDPIHLNQGLFVGLGTTSLELGYAFKLL